MNYWCELVGHKLKGPFGVHTNFAEFNYNVLICQRCKSRFTASSKDAIKKKHVDDYINLVMNQARADGGLPPLDFSHK